MKKVTYKLNKNGDFLIRNYNRAKAFSSFFPGIAGLYGIPLWAFYVNRGQCIASFGIEDKDSAILEFFPANQAYNLTPIRGFRTFLKLKKMGKDILYEPFVEKNSEAAKYISTKMVINPAKLEIEEVNPLLGLRINVTYITIPNEPFAGLARRVEVANISKSRIETELLDGLPQIVPFGMTEWHQKHMSRTIEAWMRVLNLENKAPFYSLKVNPQDRPELGYIERGNFYIACQIDGRRAALLRPAADPDILFGKNSDISYPRIFVEKRSLAFKKQKCEGKMPSAVAYAKFTVNAGQSRKIVSLIGNVKDIKSVNAILQKIKNPDYFEEKLSENEDIIKRLENRIFTKSSSDEFDFYARQTYLDNLLRGGFPVSIDTTKGPFVYYAYARKHGDLERDYNAFLLQPSYYSQGNGAYRDINQNRRNDVLFSPDVKDENILTFVNAIQPDGFNPHLIEGISLSVRNRKALDAMLKRHIKSQPKREKAERFLLEDFTPGALISFLEKERIAAGKEREEFLKEILAVSVKEDVIRPGEGYWIDHWTYNIDLFENYLACYPERLRELFLGKKRFTFYDTHLRVVPRSEKYVYPVRDIKDTGQKNKISNGVYVDGKIRQFGAVIEDGDKLRMIEARPNEPRKARTDYGKGKVYKTNFLAKAISVIANKMASLDPFGIGIELEAGKPGWCDGLNGLPAIFGSSLCEVFELKRLMLFIKSSIDKLKVRDDYKIKLPQELAGFLVDLGKLANRNLSSESESDDFSYWDLSQERKERYRREVWLGFSGKEKSISMGDLKETLDKFLLKVEKGIKKGFNKKKRMTNSYYINEVKRFSFIYDDGRKRLNKERQPLVKALSFSHRPLPLFLEGPMHAMRVMGYKDAKSLYRAIRKSGIFDAKLKMYKLNEPLESEPLEIGRSAVFTPGWLENESIWLHMEYKYLVELLKAGLYDEFFADFKNCLVPFQDPKRYGRSILENSSFIAGSAYPDKELHGTGFVARLTGTTTEFLTIWLLMSLGKRPFRADERGKLYFEPKPIIPGWLFTKEESLQEFYSPDGAKEGMRVPKNGFACCLLGKTLLIYRNPQRRNTFGKDAVRPTCIILMKKGKPDVRIDNSSTPLPFAQRIRDGVYDRIDIELG